MKLAKDCIDIGIHTNQRQAQLDFWQGEVGLPFEELLKVGGGSHQLRHSLNGSIFKLNHSRAALPETGRTGYSELLIARPDCKSEQSLFDPDKNKVTLVPAGHLGISRIGIRIRVSSVDAYHHFYRDILQIEQVDDYAYQWGTTVFLIEEDATIQPVSEMRGIGYRYITVQVWNVDEEHDQFVSRGGTAAAPPRTLGTTARISFIKDPDGNWIEVSQRASLTGELTRS